MSSEIVPRAPYLFVRKGSFYFDMRVPGDVAAAFGSKAIRFSLRTKDRKRAIRLVGEHLGLYMDRFAELRRGDDAEQAFSQKTARHDLSKLSRAELERLVTGYYRDVLRPAAASSPIDSDDRAELVGEWGETLARLNDRRNEEGNERVRSTADHILFTAGWPRAHTHVRGIERRLPGIEVDRAAEQYRTLTDLVRRASVEGSRLALAELNGAAFTPVDPLFEGGFDLAEANYKLGPHISEALAAWREGGGVRGSRRPRELTAHEAANAVRQFKDVHGDMRIGEITKRHVQEYAAAIVKIPARLPAKLAQLPVPELLACDLEAYPPRSVATINKAFGLLSAIVEQSRKRSDLEAATAWPNHFPGAKLDGDKTAEPDRVPFVADDLRRIFAEGPVHGLRQRQAGGKGEAQHWLPLLALLTGARLSELGQLRACDVCTDDGGVAFLDIGTSGGRTVKTRTSVRRVPLHPELRHLGFLTYVERVKASAGADGALWPLLRSARGRAHTAAWSQWFGKYLRRKPLSITDRRKVFHSFRHLFKDMCRDAGLSEDVHDALTGHAAAKSVGRGYGSGHSVARLYAEISKVVAPVDISHLYVAKVRKAPAGYKARISQF